MREGSDPDFEEPGETSAWARLRHSLTVVAVSAIALSAVALWAWEQGSERRAVRALPAAERRQLFERTRQDLESVCKGGGDPRLRAYCREQAEFILTFPECDETCSALATGVLAQPVR